MSESNYRYGAARRISPVEPISKWFSTHKKHRDQIKHWSIKTPRNPPCRTQQSLRIIGDAELLWGFNLGVKRGEEMNTSVEKGLSQGFLHCKRDYGSSITLRSKARGDII